MISGIDCLRFQVITLVYPGLCDTMGACNTEGGKWSGPDAAHPHPWCNITTECVDGVNLVSAVPANPEDPLMINWTKLGPIVNASTGCDGHCNASAPYFCSFGCFFNHVFTKRRVTLG